MKKLALIAASGAMAALCLGSAASAATMTYNSFGLSTAATPYTTYVEDGISMSPDILGGHYDIYGNEVGGTAADNVAAVHTGNSAERVKFTFNAGKFDLKSLDITGWLLRDNLPLVAMFAGSNGATHSVAENTVCSGSGEVRPAPGEPPPLKWSALKTRKAEYLRWPLSPHTQVA